MKIQRPLRCAMGVIAYVTVQNAVFAQVPPPPGATVNYGPSSVAGVPTLGEWGMLALMVLMVAVGYHQLRSRHGNKTLAALLIAGAVGFVALHADRVMAVGGFNNPAGGSFHVCGSGPWSNSTGVPLTVNSVTPDSGSAVDPSSTCTPGSVVPPSASCTVNLTGTSAVCGGA